METKEVLWNANGQSHRKCNQHWFLSREQTGENRNWSAIGTKILNTISKCAQGAALPAEGNQDTDQNSSLTLLFRPLSVQSQCWIGSVDSPAQSCMDCCNWWRKRMANPQQSHPADWNPQVAEPHLAWLWPATSNIDTHNIFSATHLKHRQHISAHSSTASITTLQEAAAVLC